MKKIIIDIEKYEDELSLEYLESLGYKTNPVWRSPEDNSKMKKLDVSRFLSHLDAWKECIDLNEPVVVVESESDSDVELDDNHLKGLLSESKLVYLSYEECGEVTDLSKELDIPSQPKNISAYIITPEVANTLIESGILQLICPIDTTLSLIHEFAQTKALKENLFPINESNLKLKDSDWFIDFKVHVITVGTDPEKCTLIKKSAEKYGIELNNIAENKEWEGKCIHGPGGSHKITYLRLATDKFPLQDIVLFTDAYDVFFADSLDSIVNKFLESGARALFSVSKIHDYQKSSIEERFDKVNNDQLYRYLNAGGFITDVHMLKEIIRPICVHQDDDHTWYAERYFSGQCDIQLDYNAEIFQTHDEKVVVRDSKLFNQFTKSNPSIYHGNGGDESDKFLKILSDELFEK